MLFTFFSNDLISFTCFGVLAFWCHVPRRPCFAPVRIIIIYHCLTSGDFFHLPFQPVQFTMVVLVVTCTGLQAQRPLKGRKYKTSCCTTSAEGTSLQSSEDAAA